MREPPPTQLAALLAQLGLAAERDFARVEATVHRLAGNLPRFESVWIDALRQARILTHFQAAEIHAGRGEALAVARYVLCQPVHECGYTTVYRAEDRRTREIVRLAVFGTGCRVGFSPPSDEDGLKPTLLTDALLPRLENLIAVGKDLSRLSGIIVAGGLDGSSYWAASPWVEGTSLADLVLHHGRFPPEAVMEIARAMLAELAALEAAGLVHGDIRLGTVLIASDGEVQIPHAGLRGVIRPQEGTSRDDVAPEACSTLAPERVAGGTPPTVASDLFACGCVWWHLLCGRPPRPAGSGCPGGDSLAAAIDDLPHWAADVPDALVEAIGHCLQKDPHKRPLSMAELARRLGPLRRQGRQTIARCLVAAASPRAPWLRSKRTQGKKTANPHRFTVAALALVAAVAVAWPLWVAGNRPRGAGSGARGAGGRIASLDSPLSREPAGTHHSPRDEVHHAGDEYNSPRAIVDPAVTPAEYAAESSSPRSIAKIADGGSSVGRIANPSYNPGEELRLPIDRPVRGESLQFKPGLRVRAEGGRARLVVPRGGLAVEADRLSFENIDFVREEPAGGRAAGVEASGPLVRLLAAECDFAGCSFQSVRGSPELGAAIVWQNAASARPAAIGLPAGRIRMRNCVFRRVSAGIELQLHGAIDLEIVNALCLGPGPMIRLTHAPAADEPVRISLAQVTLREADALLDCRGIDRDLPAGEIGIEASGCVLAPRAQAALLILTADAFPGPFLHEVKWAGQGSVVAGQVAFARWCGRDGARQTVDDATLSIAGLVRGEVEFAGRFDGQPANSRIVNCQAPSTMRTWSPDSDSAGAAVRDLPPEVEAERK